MPDKSHKDSWPDGVIARYLTSSGATVDLTHQLTLHTPPQAYVTLAACAGCLASSEHSHHRLVWGATVQRNEHHPDAADLDARAWAQSHAEKCRAMSKPTV